MWVRAQACACVLHVAARCGSLCVCVTLSVCICGIFVCRHSSLARPFFAGLNSFRFCPRKVSFVLHSSSRHGSINTINQYQFTKKSKILAKLAMHALACRKILCSAHRSSPQGLNLLHLFNRAWKHSLLGKQNSQSSLHSLHRLCMRAAVFPSRSTTPRRHTSVSVLHVFSYT